jgi:DNA-binding GntR family transcriptional regulator
MRTIEDGISIPKYHKLKQILRRDIIKGKYRPGELIPSENELRKRYSVSSTTVRRALSDLVHERLLIRGQGIGTFVNKPPVERSLWKIMSFTKNMIEMGYKPSAKVLDMQILPCPEEILPELTVQNDEPVFCITRLCYGDEIPMMYESVYIREELCPDMSNHNLSGSITNLLMEEYGHKITRINQSLQFSSPDKKIRQLMEIDSNSVPFFMVSGTQSIRKGLPILYECAYYRGDMYIFNINISEYTG